ncbi:MAG: hypothetical protein KBD37_01190 [Burkholderiales bacterium]|nr:hypothetical protein [Burkholderiales bacterium]
MNIKSVLTGVSSAAKSAVESAAKSAVENGVNRVLKTAADQFPNQVTRRDPNNGDASSDIVNLVGDVKNDFLSAIGFKRTLDTKETTMLVKIITAAIDYKGTVEINNGLNLKINNYNRIDICTQKMNLSTYAMEEKIKSITFSGPKELEKFYNDCAKQILDSEHATDEDKLIANRFLSGRSAEEKDIISSNSCMFQNYGKELKHQKDTAVAHANNLSRARLSMPQLKPSLIENNKKSIDNIELASTNPQQALANEKENLKSILNILEQVENRGKDDPNLLRVVEAINISKKLIETLMNQRDVAKRLVNSDTKNFTYKNDQWLAAKELFVYSWDSLLTPDESVKVDDKKNRQIKMRILNILTPTSDSEVIDKAIEVIKDALTKTDSGGNPIAEDPNVLLASAKLLGSYLLQCSEKDFKGIERAIDLQKLSYILRNDNSAAVMNNVLLFKTSPDAGAHKAVKEKCALFLAQSGDAKYKRDALEWLSQHAHTQELKENAREQLNALPPAAAMRATGATVSP